MKELLKKLSETYGPSGREAAVRELILGELEAAGALSRKGAAASVDAMGNLIVRIPGTGGGRRIMLAAHMDEIGAIVTHVDAGGFARFAPLGGVRTLNLHGGRVLFSSGVVGSIGLERLEEPSRVPGIDKFFIDTGAGSRESCPVKVGDMACFLRDFTVLGDRVAAKAMDDRVGCAVLIRALTALPPSPHEISFVFTVQEEVGLRGATTSGYGVDPEIAIAVDVTATGDTPECAPMAVSLGAGPAVKVKDSGMLSHTGVKDWLVRTAEKAGVPHQLEVLEGGTTDARAIQLSRAGVPAGCISIPCRYVHSPSEMVDLRDAEGAVKLLVTALSGPADIGGRDG